MKRRILLDSNVWRYFIDANELPSLLTATRRSRHTVVMSPAVLYEAAKTGNVAVRDKLLSAMTLPAWKRMMPEAYCEAAMTGPEARVETGTASRIIPSFLSASRTGSMPALESRPISWNCSECENTVRAARRQTSTGVPLQPFYGRRWLTHSLHQRCRSPLRRPIPPSPRDEDHHPYLDWLGGDIELNMMLFQSESLAKFWLHEVENVRMPRHWLRWAFEFLQRQYAVSDGTPVDAQLGTYLVDVDLFLSADKTMVKIAEKCRADAPFRLAESLRVPGGDACVEAVLCHLSAP